MAVELSERGKAFLQENPMGVYVVVERLPDGTPKKHLFKGRLNGTAVE